ncbi:MAG TPA: Glu/Leu/Phe/Val dehydrogenase dimerization domain-containing protein, partial [Streptosporangiaceae bacterium]|nr:Glu/Leu/Phe/Val dehydrogenase dimerization domain-containing protein [Streptosporangiaceae bacterium]
VVFDLPGAPLSAGGTRLAPDVSVTEVAVLARSMTYKFAALGERVGGGFLRSWWGEPPGPPFAPAQRTR